MSQTAIPLANFGLLNSVIVGAAMAFSMLEIAELLKLWKNQDRASADVKRITLAHVADLKRSIEEMQAMRQTLQELASCCQGNHRPDCPILSGLAEPVSAPC